MGKDDSCVITSTSAETSVIKQVSVRFVDADITASVNTQTKLHCCLL